MAQQFLSLNKGQSTSLAGNVIVATSVPTADVYVQVLSTNSLKALDVIIALKRIVAFLESNGIPGGSGGTNLPVQA